MKPMMEKNLVISFVSYVMAAVSNFCVIFIIAHKFNVDLMGIYGYSYGIANVFLFLSNIGFDEAQLTNLPKTSDPHSMMGSYLVLKLLLALGMFVIVFTIFLIFHNTLFDAINPVAFSLAMIFLGSNVLLGFGNFFIFTFIALGKITKSQISMVVGAYVNLVFVIIGTNFDFSLPTIAISGLIGNCVAVFISITLFLHDFSINSLKFNKIKPFIKLAYPFMIISVIGILQMNLDKVFLLILGGTYEEGLYFGVQKFYPLLIIIANVSFPLLIQLCSKSFSEKRVQELNRLVTKVESYFSMFWIPALLWVIVFSPSIINLFLGPSFLPAQPILILFCIQGYLISISMVYYSYLMGSGKLKVYTIGAIAELVVNLICLSILVPMFGGIGAILTLIIGSSIRISYYKWFFINATKSKFNFRIIIHLVAGVFSYFMTVYVVNLFPPFHYQSLVNQLLPVLIGSLCIVLFYFPILLISKELRIKDIKSLTQLIIPSKIKRI